MRADNDGEGGIMALITLLRRWGADSAAAGAPSVLAALGIFGAALFFGDSMITPAISVLSAVEGLKVVEPALDELVVPITAVIIVVLFAVQRHGTAAVGRLFGPVMIVWFARHRRLRRRRHRRRTRRSSRRCRRRTRVGFLVGHFDIAFFALAAVVLAVTGAEALYADMGHFGRRAITRGWLFLVFPACMLSYLGQGALILGDPSNVEQPVLPARARVGAAADGAAGHRGDRDRLPGGDHRRLLGGRRRPPSSATCRGCGSRTPRSRRSARSTCRGSTGC